MLWNSLFGYLMGGVNNAMYISDILIHSETEEEHCWSSEIGRAHV